MAPMRSRPLREILVPSRRRRHHHGRESESRLPEAPPLYQWNDYDSCALSSPRDNENCHDEDDDVTSVVTLDQAIDDRLQQDKCPCLPLRQAKQQQQEPVLPTSTTSPSAAISPAQTLPPRRPRRCASPLRNPQGIDVANVPLKPLAFVHQKQQQQQNLSSLDRTDHSKNSSVVEIKYDMALPLSEIVKSGKQSFENTNNNNNNNKVTLVFCIRRTGCGACREHGMQLSALARQMPCVDMMGVVKPEAVPETTLLEFYTEYFNFPLYQDDDWQLYSAMGQPRISLWHMMTTAPRMERRYKQKGIRNIPLGGDLWTNGGLLILDAQQRLRYVYLEQYGDELDIPAIAWAIEQARRPVAAPTGMTCAKDGCSTLSSPWSTTNTSSELPQKPQRRPSPMRRRVAQNQPDSLPRVAPSTKHLSK